MLSTALYLLLLGVFVDETRSCPGCNRTEANGRVSVRCGSCRGADSVLLQFHRIFNKLTLTCENGTYSCSMMSEARSVFGSSVGLAAAAAPVYLQFFNCSLDEPLACAVAAINATDVRTLILRDLRGELLPRHVSGLRSVQELRMQSGVETSIPYRVLSHLPALSTFKAKYGYFHVKEEPDQHLLQLRALELSDVHLNVLPARSFSSTPNLLTLKLSGNQMPIIDKDAFEGLSSLKELYLSNNSINELAAGIFSDMKLKKLYMERNKIEHLPIGLFDGQVALKTLSLNNNSIWYAPAGIFDNLVNLTVLNLRSNKLENLQSRNFNGLGSLEELYLSNNLLTTLSPSSFEGLHSLLTLELSHNILTTLSPSTFECLHSLSTLDLSHNILTTLSPSTFEGLNKLLTLDLSYNLLTILSPYIFDVLHSLEVLRVSHNKLQIPDITSPFKELLKLRTLDLEYNCISRVCRDWHELPNLNFLDLSHNEITRLTREDMTWKRSASILVSHNNITNIQVPKFTDFTELTHFFTLHHNPFHCDCTLYPFIKALKENHLGFIVGQDDMICLSPPGLAGRRLSNVLGDLLRCTTCPNSCSCAIRKSTTMTDVYELNCSSVPLFFPSTDLPFKLTLNNIPNKISNLPPEVKHLIISNLSLTKLPYIDACFEVDLRHNLLTEAPLHLLEANCSVKLAHNPFKCDCDNQKTFMLLKKYKNQIIDLSEVTCSGGLSIQNYRVEELCVTRDSILLGLGVSAGIISFGACAILIYAKKRRILLYLIRYRLYHPRKVDRRDTNYDAFVSFEDEDEKFVYQQLIPKLESGRCPLRLCIPCRDWEVGGLISEQISRSVKESRVTIVVLSAHYGKSTWRKIEFRTAQALQSIIVLVMEDVANRCSDLGLKTYTSMNKCIKASDSMVWYKIKQAVGVTDAGLLSNIDVDGVELSYL